MAPVNPAVHVSPPLEVSKPGVVDLVNPALKTEGEPVHTSVPDPIRRSAETPVESHDWTIHHPTPVKVEDPPPKPISQVLMDHLKTVWTASASAIQIEQVKNQLTPPAPTQPAQTPGDLAKQVLVYTPSKINKSENI